MSFREVEVKKISQREKVFDFELEHGDRIRILSSIANGNGKSKSVFSRKSIKIGLVDKDGEYVNHDQFPKLVAVDHSKSTVGNFINNLMERIENISQEMQDEYQARGDQA